MASNIVYTTIDAEYPVAGQDNDSQGFRDNFSILKTGLQVASSEITDLQDSTAKLDEANNFNGSNLISPNIVTETREFINRGTQNVNGANIEVDFEAGYYQLFTIAETMTLTFANWPTSGKYAEMRIHLVSNGVANTLTFSAGAGVLKTDDSASITMPDNTDDVLTFDVWTYNAGQTVFLKSLGTFN